MLPMGSHLSFLICAQDLWMLPSASNYSADNMWATAWPRLNFKYAARLVPVYSADKEQGEARDKRDSMYIRERGRKNAISKKDGGGGFQADRSLIS